tara:strand:- start:53 stop:808 length:756 start_codon:yes stop_codon:yes gene_type:complete
MAENEANSAASSTDTKTESAPKQAITILSKLAVKLISSIGRRLTSVKADLAMTRYLIRTMDKSMGEIIAPEGATVAQDRKILTNQGLTSRDVKSVDALVPFALPLFDKSGKPALKEGRLQLANAFPSDKVRERVFQLLTAKKRSEAVYDDVKDLITTAEKQLADGLDAAGNAAGNGAAGTTAGDAAGDAADGAGDEGPPLPPDVLVLTMSKQHMMAISNADAAEIGAMWKLKTKGDRINRIDKLLAAAKTS